MTTESVIRHYLPCSTPKNNRVNFSWGSGYHWTLAVYYNSHCSKAMDVLIHVVYKDGATRKKCLVVPAGKKGSKKWTVYDAWHGDGHAYKVTRGC